MKIPDKYKETGVYHTILTEKYKYQPKSGGKRKKKEERTRYRAVFALLKPNGEWDVRQYTKGGTKREAQNWIDERLREHENKGTKPIIHRKLLFSAFAETYKQALKMRDLATADEELKKVDLMIEFFGNDKLSEIDYERIIAFKQYLFDTPSKRAKKVFDKEKKEYKTVFIETKRQAATVHRYMARLRDLLKQAVTAQKIKSVPHFDKVIAPRLETVRKATITTAEFLRLLRECDTVASNHDRKHLKLPLIASHELGCRIGELQEVTRGDILVIDHKRNSGIVRMPIGKTRPRKYKEVPITKFLYNAIIENRILDKADDEPAFYTYKTYRRAWATLKRLAGIDPLFRWHDLRAVNTTNRKHGGQVGSEVQSQVGHAQGSKMTERHYYRPHFEQLMDSIKPYDDYMEKLLQQENILIIRDNENSKS
jgi:integrase